MLQVRPVALVILGSALAAVPVFAQEGYRSDVSVQFMGSFGRETTKDGVKQSTSNSGGMLASYRHFAGRHHGFELSYGDTTNTQRYGLSSGDGDMSTHSRELTAAYVFRVPFRRCSAFGLAGAADLVFQTRSTPKWQNQASAAFVYGGGVDADITKRMFFRSQYRGLVYDSPTWSIPALAGLNRVTHRAELSAGFGIRF